MAAPFFANSAAVNKRTAQTVYKSIYGSGSPPRFASGKPVVGFDFALFYICRLSKIHFQRVLRSKISCGRNFN